MEFLKTIYYTVGFWIISFLSFLLEKLSPIIGELSAILVVYAFVVITILLMVFFSVSFLLKNKYRTSICFFIILFIMLSYIIILVHNIGTKGFK